VKKPASIPVKNNNFGLDKNLSDLDRFLFASQKGGQFSTNTICLLFMGLFEEQQVQGREQSPRLQEPHHVLARQRRGHALAGYTSGHLHFCQAPGQRLELELDAGGG
jgi:integrase/recombinase XerD